MLARFKKKAQSYSYNKARENTLKRLEKELAETKGFHLKDLFLAADNVTAIAIDRSNRSLNLISVDKSSIKSCLIQYSDLIAVELFKRGRCENKFSRQTGLTLSQQERILNDALVEHLTKTFPKYSKILCLHTSRQSTPLFVIDFYKKRDESTNKRLEVRNAENRWFDRCVEIIVKGDQKAEEVSYQSSFFSTKEDD